MKHILQDLRTVYVANPYFDRQLKFVTKLGMVMVDTNHHHSDIYDIEPSL